MVNSSPQLNFTRLTEYRIIYGHNPEELSEQVLAAQLVAERKGYLIDKVETTSDGIWWVSTCSFWKNGGATE